MIQFFEDLVPNADTESKSRIGGTIIFKWRGNSIESNDCLNEIGIGPRTTAFIRKTVAILGILGDFRIRSQIFGFDLRVAKI